MDFFSVYNSVRVAEIEGRYVCLSDVLGYLDKTLFAEFAKVLGHSEKNVSIMGYQFGSGSCRVLAWSQMHGNESTTTKALLDWFALMQHDTAYRDQLFERYTFLIIPVLNPDGAYRYTRLNACEVDLNRDARELSQRESRVLRQTFDDFCPDLCLNLHGQRTIFSAGSKGAPATVSFLAPAADEARSITPARQRAMQLIAGMNEALQEYIPNGVGRYDDGYNSNCFGDFFQGQGVPTLLFEAGHHPDDYPREQTRKLIGFALWYLLQIATSDQKLPPVEAYFSIPENHKDYRDVIIRNAKVGGKLRDVVLQFRETLVGNRIVFEPIVESIEVEAPYRAHKSFDAGEQETRHTNGKTIQTEDVLFEFLMGNQKISFR